MTYQEQVHRWDVFEVACDGPAEGNPFADHSIQAVFQGENETVTVEGFYDGEGVYRVRFMPSFEGAYTFAVECSFAEAAAGGAFVVLPAGEGNHGPVRVANTWHFAYEDGTPYYSIGTTCYVWNLQSDALVAQTLETLRHSAFNKIRFCAFPKHYDYNLGEPRSYPYQGTPMDSSVLTKENFFGYTGKTEGNAWDFTRFNPAHFRHIEGCILALQKLGIEADLILFHPYDRWGFSSMTQQQDALYLRYVLARFSAFRNVWWSLANEYDLMPAKSLRDWENIARVVCQGDPYRHLRSIHNCANLYDYSRAWITHCSIQRVDMYKTAEMTGEWRARYRKPVVLDEIAYEGDIQYGWGNITGQEMLRRFWEGALRGGYAGHGETYLREDDVLWWSHGGALHGESHKRLALLRDIMGQTPGVGLSPHIRPGAWDEVCAVPEDLTRKGGPVRDYYLCYYGFMQPAFRDFFFDPDTAFQVRVIDTWNQTVEERGVHQGRFRIELPRRQYMAIQLRRVP